MKPPDTRQTSKADAEDKAVAGAAAEVGAVVAVAVWMVTAIAGAFGAFLMSLKLPVRENRQAMANWLPTGQLGLQFGLSFMAKLLNLVDSAALGCYRIDLESFDRWLLAQLSRQRWDSYSSLQSTVSS